MSTDASPDPVRQLMARLNELRPGGAPGMADRVPMLVRLHPPDRGDRDPAPVGVGVGHHPIGPVDQDQARAPFRLGQPVHTGRPGGHLRDQRERSTPHRQPVPSAAALPHPCRAHRRAAAHSAAPSGAEPGREKRRYSLSQPNPRHFRAARARPRVHPWWVRAIASVARDCGRAHLQRAGGSWWTCRKSASLT